MPIESEPLVDYQVTTKLEGEYVHVTAEADPDNPPPIVGSGVPTPLRKVFSPRIQPGSSLV